MSIPAQNAQQTSAGPQRWLGLADAAARMQLPVSALRRMIAEGKLLAIRRDREDQIPVDFLAEPTDDGDPAVPVKGLAGTITLLRDAGFASAEAIGWLYAADDTLPGTPIEALRADRGTEVHRRAQAAGF